MQLKLSGLFSCAELKKFQNTIIPKLPIISYDKTMATFKLLIYTTYFKLGWSRSNSDI